MVNITGRGTIVLCLFGVCTEISTANERLARIFLDHQFVRRCPIVLFLDSGRLEVGINANLCLKWRDINLGQPLAEALLTLGDTYVHQTVVRTESEIGTAMDKELLDQLKEVLDDLRLELGTTLWPEELHAIGIWKRDH